MSKEETTIHLGLRLVIIHSDQWRHWIGYLHEHDAIVSRIGTSVQREAVDKGETPAPTRDRHCLPV